MLDLCSTEPEKNFFFPLPQKHCSFYLHRKTCCKCSFLFEFMQKDPFSHELCYVNLYQRFIQSPLDIAFIRFSIFPDPFLHPLHSSSIPAGSGIRWCPERQLACGWGRAHLGNDLLQGICCSASDRPWCSSMPYETC